MAIDNPLSSISFSLVAGQPPLPDTANAGLLLGCGPAQANTPRTYGSGAAVRSVFSERMLTEVAEAHFATDPARHPILVCGMDVTTAGVLHLDTSAVTGGGTVTADVTTKPLGDWPDLYFEFIAGGTAGTAGILVDVSLDGGLKKNRIALGTSTNVEISGTGIKFGLSGVFDTGSIITGWTSPPKWDADDFAAAQAAILETSHKFSLIHIPEPIEPSEGTLLSGLLNALRDGTPARPAHIIANQRRKYKPSAEATITATFANANPDTLARAAGSWVTDGFKAGMRITVAGAVNSANNNTFLRIATVTTLTLTMTTNVAFTAEASTADVTVSGIETLGDYAENVASEWNGFRDGRISFTNTPIRAARPYDGFSPDQNLAGYLWARCVATPIGVEPAKRKRDATTGGGPVAPELSGRITEANVLVLPDAAITTALVAPPSRTTALQREKDGSGPYFTQARTSDETSASDRIVHARILNEAKYTIIAVAVPLIFDQYDADPSNPNKLSSEATEAIESALRVALQRKLGAAINNAYQEDPEAPLVTIAADTDLSTGIVNVETFFRSKFYLRGLAVRMAIKVPGT